MKLSPGDLAVCVGRKNRSWDLRAASTTGSQKIGAVFGGMQAIVLAVIDPAALTVMVMVGSRVGWLAGAALRKRTKNKQ
jgi:hypothetical protein